MIDVELNILLLERGSNLPRIIPFMNHKLK